jgi:hypothetical protein
VSETVDSALKDRLRAVVDRQPVTEAELRSLAEQGQAVSLILGARLESSKQRLAQLTSDPESSLADVAGAFRQVNELGPDLDELEELLAGLDARAREVRASWLAQR